MNTLDHLKQIKKLDPGRVLESIEMLGEQFNQAWQEIGRVKTPASHKKINKILINGMGGSALGSQITRSVFFDQLKIPFGIINSYQLPASLDKNTLYIISSYSGNTEEPLSTFLAARKRGAKIFGLTSGGKLANWIKQQKLPGYIFNTPFNPSQQPRLGLGYSFGAQLGLFKRLGLIKVRNQEIKKALVKLDQLNSKFSVYNPIAKNLAKKLTIELQNKTPIIIASEFLAGNAHSLANQFNETAKTFSGYYLISELNHHLLEGLVFPKTNNQNLVFLFFESKLYHPQNQIRFKITKQVVVKNKINSLTYQLVGQNKLEQALELLLFGNYLSFYTAILNGVNPAKIPFVDYFKAQLKKYR